MQGGREAVPSHLERLDSWLGARLYKAVYKAKKFEFDPLTPESPWRVWVVNEDGQAWVLNASLFSWQHQINFVEHFYSPADTSDNIMNQSGARMSLRILASPGRGWLSSGYSCLSTQEDSTGAPLCLYHPLTLNILLVLSHIPHAHGVSWNVWPWGKGINQWEGMVIEH